MKLSELLTEATWIKGPMAKREDGESCLPTSDRACKWCLLGAMFKLKLPSRAYEDMRALVANYGFHSIPGFNDDENTTWGMVKGVIQNYESPPTLNVA